jgi:hypothetical protein
MISDCDCGATPHSETCSVTPIYAQMVRKYGHDRIVTDEEVAYEAEVFRAYTWLPPGNEIAQIFKMPDVWCEELGLPDVGPLWRHYPITKAEFLARQRNYQGKP